MSSLLADWRAGDETARDRLAPILYQELRRLANHQLKGERPDHTLQPTALVHEVWLRLHDGATPDWQDRAHFFAVAARTMRRVLVDHARSRGAAKRGGDRFRVSLEEDLARVAPRSADLLALDQALEELAVLEERKCRVIELRYFGGLTIEETAEVLGVSAPTVVNDTRFARAWLLDRISRESAR